MRKLLRLFRLAEYGGDELALATLACALLGWALARGFTPYAVALVLPPWFTVLWFFRDPDRKALGAPDAPGIMISPADGTVTDVEEVDEASFIGGRAVRVGIFLSPFSVHVNRAPCEGTVAYLKYRAGDFLPAYNPKAPEKNESQELGLCTPGGLKVMVKQISGILARRIVCEARPGERLAPGERYGMIKFGSRTELYVPAEAGWRLEVSPGQKVKGGESVLMKEVPRAERAGAGAGADVPRPDISVG